MLMSLKTNRQKDQFTALVWKLEMYVQKNLKRAPSKDMLEVQAREIASSVYDLPHICTGKASVMGLIALFNKEIKTMTIEHLWPRQLMGKKLIKTFMRLGRVDEKKLVKMLLQYCSVNRTHPKENVTLKKYQTSDAFVSPDKSYRNAGIKLVRWANGTKIEKLPELYPSLKPHLQKKVRKSRKGK